MGFSDRLKREALGLSQKAIERLFADDKRASQLATVIGKVAQGKAALDQGQATLLHQLNFATRGDFKELGKRLSALRRRVREVGEKL